MIEKLQYLWYDNWENNHIFLNERILWIIFVENIILDEEII